MPVPPPVCWPNKSGICSLAYKRLLCQMQPQVVWQVNASPRPNVCLDSRLIGF